MSNYTDTFRKPAMTDETGIAIAEKLGGDTASEYKVNTSAEYRKAPMSDETAREILAKIDGGGSGASALSELSDVTLTSPSDGQVLHYDGTEWINATPVTELPAVTSDDNGKVLSVVEGVWDKTVPKSEISIYLIEDDGNGEYLLSNNKTVKDIVTDITSGKFVVLKHPYNYYILGDYVTTKSEGSKLYFHSFASTNGYSSNLQFVNLYIIYNNDTNNKLKKIVKILTIS